MSNSHRIAKARDNINRTGGQAEFHGNENTPIQAGINEHKVVDVLGHHSQKDNQVGHQSKALLDHLGNAQGGWKVTAGIHQGGLGGAAGGADPRNHITLNTGHHIRLNNKGDVSEITGPGIPEGKGRQGPSEPSPTENSINRLQNEHGLTAPQAVKAHNLMTRGGDTGRLPEHKAVATVKANTK
jgi:hypothetical protein